MSNSTKGGRIEELETVFRDHKLHVPTLERLLQLLSGRDGQRARDLRGAVLRRLGELHSKQPETGATAIGRDNARIVRMRPCGTPGLAVTPSPQLSNRLKLNIAAGAGCRERYAAALEALIENRRTAKNRKSRELRHGERKRKAGEWTLYEFELSDQSQLPDDAKIDLEVGTFPPTSRPSSM